MDSGNEPGVVVRIIGFRWPSVVQAVFFGVFGPALGASIIYEGFLGSPNFVGGLFGIALVIASLVFVPRVWRGGWIQFTATGLEVHSAWSRVKSINYGEIERVDVFINWFPIFVIYMPRIVMRTHRPLLLNDFVARALTPARAHALASGGSRVFDVGEQIRIIVDQHLPK